MDRLLSYYKQTALGPAFAVQGRLIYVMLHWFFLGSFTFSVHLLYTFCTPFWQADAWRYMKIHFCPNPEKPCATRIYRGFMDL